MSVPQVQPLWQTLSLESPFAWRSESYQLSKQIQFFPKDPTLSFVSTRVSKVTGYIPLVGTVVGIYRVYKGTQEYNLFKKTHLHSLSNRSLQWIARGCLESIPVLGGIACMITDVIATILSRGDHSFIKTFPDETACGYCHQCR